MPPPIRGGTIISMAELHRINWITIRYSII